MKSLLMTRESYWGEAVAPAAITAEVVSRRAGKPLGGQAVGLLRQAGLPQAPHELD